MTTTVFRGGTVWTGDPARPTADALAVSAGRICAVGDDVDTGDEYVDLAGGWLLPAFRDGHAHPMQGGIELDGVPLVGASSVEEIAAAVAAYAAEHPKRQWLVGGGYDPALAPRGNFDAAWLDAAAPGRAVVLTAADHHTAWVSSEALRRAGCTAATPDPPNGTIVRRADGSPLGTLREAAVSLVERVMPAMSDDDRIRGLRAALERFAAAGVVWVQDAWVETEHVPAYLAAAGGGELACRVNLALLAKPGSWRAQLAELARARDEVAASGADAVSCRTVKFFADGIIEGGTAALLEPYLDDPCSHGTPNWPLDELAAALEAVDELGLQPHIHAIGDAGIRTALDALEELERRRGRRDRRPVIAHVQLPHPDDVRRFAALDVIANVEPLWAQLDACQVELTLPRLGDVRGAWQYPLRQLLDAGARLTFGSDWPVSSLAPLHGIAVAVTRQTAGGEPSGGWLPQQRISVEEAIRAYTAGSAYQGFDDDAGVLTVGSRADLVWLAASPFDVPPAEIAGIEVLGTWVGGRRTYVA